MSATIGQEPLPSKMSALPAQADAITAPIEIASSRQRGLPTAHRRTRSSRVWHATLRVVKGLFIASELCAIVALIAYAGWMKVLPSVPPSLHVITPSHDVAARRGSYCWLVPGAASCVDTSDGAVATTALPMTTTRAGGTVDLRFAYPSPTSCEAAVTDANGVAVAAKSSHLERSAHLDPARATYQLAIALQPGTYRLSLSCTWAPAQTLRWLRGQGESHYSIALRVVAH